MMVIPSGQTRIALINMPFAAASRASIQCGLLKAALVRAGYPTDVPYYNLRMAAHIGADLYAKLCTNMQQDFVGEWLSSGAAFGHVGDESRYFDGQKQSDVILSRLGLTRDDMIHLRNVVIPGLLDTWVNEVDWNAYAAAGFSCTFEQTLASFAMAKRIRAKYPNVVIIFGGSEFDRESAEEYIRKLSFIDYIVVGDGDRALPELVGRIAKGESGLGSAGVVARGEDGTVISAAEDKCSCLDNLPDPDYTDYFTTLDTLGKKRVLGAEATFLPFQAARGCWWGQKHQCTFCGENGTEMTYRSRDTRLVFEELKRQSARYPTNLFLAVDTIMDMRLCNTLFRWIRESKLDLVTAYEVKANLTPSQLRSLVLGGLGILQPGIESLSTHLLQLMSKGTTLLLNLRVLKWSQYYRVRTAWNLLTGVPGETAEDYRSQAALIPRIVHLTPPARFASVRLVKNSPLMAARDPYFRDIQPHRAYSWLFPENLIDSARVAWTFEADPAQDDGTKEAIRALSQEVSRWQTLWRQEPRPALRYVRGSNWMRIMDQRTPQSPQSHEFGEPDTTIYESCSESPQTESTLAAALSDGLAPAGGKREIASILQRLTALGLMVEENGRYFSLALPVKPGI